MICFPNHPQPENWTLWTSNFAVNRYSSRAQISATLPFKRSGRPDEVADLVVFLASARASYISDAIVTIDAGQSSRPRG
jgi:NAD(P)-dependent dehydrogenase (short-subunit alcohol dehydrogenase family)